MFGEGEGMDRTDGTRCSKGNEITIRIAKPKQQKSCLPILRSVHGEFILCEEGVYARSPIKPAPLPLWLFLWALRRASAETYDFYDWDSLAVYRVDEKNRVVWLKVIGKGELLKLSARHQFVNLESTVRRYATTQAHPSRTERPAFRIGLLAALMGILLLAQVGAARYYEHLSSGDVCVVGDEACDVCGGVTETWGTSSGRPWVMRQWIEVTRGDQVVHEYCLGHYAIYAMIHPVQAITILVQRKLDWEQSVLTFMPAFLLWSILLSVAVVVALRPWYKTKTLY